MAVRILSFLQHIGSLKTGFMNLFLGGKLNYLFPQITLATSLKVVVRPYFDKIQQENWLQP